MVASYEMSYQLPENFVMVVVGANMPALPPETKDQSVVCKRYADARLVPTVDCKPTRGVCLIALFFHQHLIDASDGRVPDILLGKHSRAPA
jgi:hypothetical protein